MNGYLASMMSTLLGWVRSLASSVWDVVTHEDSANLLTYVSRNWKTIVAVLLIAGVLTDLIVYLFRWKPYLVWDSFFRRIREKKETRAMNRFDADGGEPAGESGEEENAPDGVPEDEMPAEAGPEPTAEFPIRRRRRLRGTADMDEQSGTAEEEPEDETEGNPGRRRRHRA